MFTSPYERVQEFENEYNSWLKQFTRVVLTRLSNYQIVTTDPDAFHLFHYTKVDDCHVIMGIEQMLTGGDDELFSDMYSDNMTNFYDDNSKLSLRSVFGSNSLVNVINCLDHILTYKDAMKDLQPKYPHFVTYLDYMIENIKLLSIYCRLEPELYPTDFNAEFILDKISKYPNLMSTDINEFINEYYKYVNEDKIQSTEAEGVNEEQELQNAQNDRERAKYIGKSLLKVKNAIDNGRLKVKHFFDKFDVMRNMFYSKNLGKIDHLYKHYSNEAMIVENEMIGDPVDILMNKCGTYMGILIDDIIKIYHIYNNHMHQMFACKSYPEMVIKVKNYLQYKEIEITPESKPSDLKKAISLDLRFRVAKAILNNNQVYGHTVESITLKKYPPIHHVMVSLFIEKPYEKPQEIPVSSVFKSAESFKIMGKKLKEVILESSKIVVNKLKSVTIENDYKMVSNNLVKFKKDAKMATKSGADNKVDNTAEKMKDLKKRITVLKDYRSIFESFVPLFIYVSEAGNVMYDIAMKIDFACKDSLKALLNAERSKADPNYDFDTSQKRDFKTSSNKQDVAGVSRKDIKKDIKKGYTDIGEDRTVKFNF